MLELGQPLPAIDAPTVTGERAIWPDGSDDLLLLCFLRPVSSPFGRAALQRLAAEAPRLEGLKILAVTPSAADRARDWLRRAPLPFPLIADADGALARRWRQGRDPWGLYSLRGLSQGDRGGASLRAALRAGMGWPERDGGWLPAELIVDSESRLRYARLGCTRLSTPDASAIRQALRRIKS